MALMGAQRRIVKKGLVVWNKVATTAAAFVATTAQLGWTPLNVVQVRDHAGATLDLRSDTPEAVQARNIEAANGVAHGDGRPPDRNPGGEPSVETSRIMPGL